MTPYKFPTFQQFMPSEKRILKRMRSGVRFYFSSFFARQEIRQFENFLNQHSLWLPLFQPNYYRCNSLLRKYCNNAFSTKARLHAICENLLLAEQIWGEKLCKTLLAEQRLLLAQLNDDLQLYLNINQIDPFEGFFSINILNRDGKSIYDASFTFLAPNRLLITSIQGPKGETASLDIKEATKSLFGVRPMFMLVNAFKIISQTLGLTLQGIAHKQQGKYRFNDHSRLLFNYDEFWKENDAQHCEPHYWTLNNHIECKPLEAIQSKKRAMYRKRYAMFETMQTQIHTFFTHFRENL